MRTRQEEVHKARGEAAEALEATLAAAKPVGPEVEAVLDKTLRSLSLKGKEPLAGAKDGGCGGNCCGGCGGRDGCGGCGGMWSPTAVAPSRIEQQS